MTKFKYLIPILGIYFAWIDWDSIQINYQGDLQRKTGGLELIVSIIFTLLTILICIL